uniref:Uncharacterized protein n=1 Tax=Anopheles farauti TaxID=69004 RepID=A0A182Q030_9DIPT
MYERIRTIVSSSLLGASSTGVEGDSFKPGAVPLFRPFPFAVGSGSPPRAELNVVRRLMFASDAVVNVFSPSRLGPQPADVRRGIVPPVAVYVDGCGMLDRLVIPSNTFAGLRLMYAPVGAVARELPRSPYSFRPDDPLADVFEKRNDLIGMRVERDFPESISSDLRRTWTLLLAITGSFVWITESYDEAIESLWPELGVLGMERVRSGTELCILFRFVLPTPPPPPIPLPPPPPPPATPPLAIVGSVRNVRERVMFSSRRERVLRELVRLRSSGGTKNSPSNSRRSTGPQRSSNSSTIRFKCFSIACDRVRIGLARKIGNEAERFVTFAKLRRFMLEQLLSLFVLQLLQFPRIEVTLLLGPYLFRCVAQFRLLLLLELLHRLAVLPGQHVHVRLERALQLQPLLLELLLLLLFGDRFLTLQIVELLLLLLLQHLQLAQLLLAEQMVVVQLVAVLIAITLLVVVVTCTPSISNLRVRLRVFFFRFCRCSSSLVKLRFAFFTPATAPVAAPFPPAEATPPAAAPPAPVAADVLAVADVALLTNVDVPEAIVPMGDGGSGFSSSKSTEGSGFRRSLGGSLFATVVTSSGGNAFRIATIVKVFCDRRYHHATATGSLVVMVAAASDDGRRTTVMVLVNGRACGTNRTTTVERTDTAVR